MTASPARVRDAAGAIGVALDDSTAERLVKFLALLTRWSVSTNLVGTRDEEELIDYHLVDSLALLEHLGEGPRVIDVGSGGGLPGAVLAIARPASRVVALEPLRKKHAFLSTVRRELALDNFRPLPEKDDAHRASSDFEPYDVAVSRATWAPAEWLARGSDLVRSGGRVLAMEGREQTALPAGASRHRYQLGDRTRAVLVLPIE